MHYHGHRKRLRQRLLDAPEKLSDYEILELLLGHVIQRRDTKPIAKKMLTRLGSLRGVVNARPDEFLDMEGVGEGVASFLVLLREFFSRYVESLPRKRETLCSTAVVVDMARQRLGNLAHEEIWLAFVDNRNRLISWEKAAKGSVNSSFVHPRDIMERALTLKASGFILVHNHPGGSPEPSAADLDYTKHLDQASASLFVRFIDHVVISDGACFSIKNDTLL